MSDRLPEGLDPEILHRVVTVQAETRHVAGMTHEASVHDFSFVSDEPASLGGTDLAPYPLDYLTAAIGL
jgi:uncharacterized OsmC-like protein